jgi:A/G-specific adenine glycosylase
MGGQADGSVYLEQRPTPGVWAGLYCLPVFDSYEALTAAVSPADVLRLEDGAVIKHVLTHKDLHIHPIRLTVKTKSNIKVAGQWFAGNEWPKLGLPAPIRKLLDFDA